MNDPTPDDLTTRHLWRTFWGGMAFTPLLCLGVAVLMSGKSGVDFMPQLGRDFISLTGAVWLIATLPALFFCWLRLGAMRWLFNYFQAQPGAGRRALVVLGMLVLFEALVLASTLGLFLFWRSAIEFRAIWSLCTAFSLPWLLAALWASWQVLRPTATSLAGAPLPQGGRGSSTGSVGE